MKNDKEQKKMFDTEKEKKLFTLFSNWFSEKANSISALSPSGSPREYYRITGKDISAIGVFNPDKKENIAFLEFSKHFLSKGLKVPQIFATDPESNIYLIQDLGNTTLYSYLSEKRINENFPPDLIPYYKKAIKQLQLFQISASKDLDYSICYPRSSFDRQSIMWDLNYFKYYFLKLAKISFDEQLLENDFSLLCNFLLQADNNYFLYRDFQSRNIMLHNEELYFIDYQGGRKGALQYDIASLLYDAKADIPQQLREELLEYYINIISKLAGINKNKFLEYYYGFVLIRILQAMGAYGYRGYYERKEHFLKSIPFALNNLAWILNNISIPVKLPALISVLKRMVESEKLTKYEVVKTPASLTVTINSFSFMKGIPEDKTGNGGGFVFDCRAINNPGRYQQYRSKTGKDKEVIDFLETQSEINKYLQNVYTLVDQSVDDYQERKFTNLMVNFGCTGGQHRSVYCAEQLKKHLREKYNVRIILNHKELDLVEQINC